MIVVKLNELLKANDKSLYWLSEQTNLSYPTIHRLASGKTTSVGFTTLNLICTVLNCKVEDIIEYIPDNNF